MNEGFAIFPHTPQMNYLVYVVRTCLFILVCVFIQIWREISPRDVLGFCVAASRFYTTCATTRVSSY